MGDENTRAIEALERMEELDECARAATACVTVLARDGTYDAGKLGTAWAEFVLAAGERLFHETYERLAPEHGDLGALLARTRAEGT